MPNPFDNISVKSQEKLLRMLESTTVNITPNKSLMPLINNDNIIGIIINGCIDIIRTDHNGVRIIIEKLQENDIFGSMISSLKNKEYDCITKEETKIILIEYNNIINCNNNKYFYNQFIKNLLQIITQKIAEKNERIEILTKKTIRNKLLEYFNIISKKYGSKNIYLPFNFTDLADYLAIDRSAMSRELKCLREEGLITTKGKKIVLLYDQII